ncbi:TetR/AcrR family transcriptional regulator [Agarivorans sp. 1_MG-2023]|uniref:TetR/AcrR family transcriptional regulator n=1 Tax=Agarivorans sp. 1_MG-2023 TaxID=3062634 RepID=UPI0026E15172|nr:TetR/AcrR family transcriptional regulator [Agarivorans sp. 1_MG-2023]
MPFSKAHKEKTRVRILIGAKTLFSNKGFDAVTVNEVMEHCSLTRGAFYAHFKSKSDLYKEALTFSAASSQLTQNKPQNTSTKEWLSYLLDGYLSIEHVRGEKPCPLAFLATDIVSRDSSTKETYANTYQNFNAIIMDYAGLNSPNNKADILSLTSMIIGAVAISRTIDDQKVVNEILTSCRQQARKILGGI